MKGVRHRISGYYTDACGPGGVTERLELPPWGVLRRLGREEEEPLGLLPFVRGLRASEGELLHRGWVWITGTISARTMKYHSRSSKPGMKAIRWRSQPAKEIWKWT